MAFISTILTLLVPLYKEGLGSFEAACKRLLRAVPPCSVGFVCAASLAEVFSQLADRQEVGGCSREKAFPGAELLWTGLHVHTWEGSRSQVAQQCPTRHPTAAALGWGWKKCSIRSRVTLQLHRQGGLLGPGGFLFK